MPRAVTAQWQHVEPDGVAAAAAQWRARREQLARSGVHYWVFRSPSDPSAFVEFVEAADAGQVQQARADAGMPPDAEILIELELS